MAYVDRYAACVDVDHSLRKKVAVAIAEAAADVLNESTETNYYSSRLTWARRMLNGTGVITEAADMLWRVTENATVAADFINAADADVQFVVNGLVNTFANK